jgi:hypothetical protein
VPLYQAMYSTTARLALARLGQARVPASALSQHWPVRPTDRVTWFCPARAAYAADSRTARRPGPLIRARAAVVAGASRSG